MYLKTIFHIYFLYSTLVPIITVHWFDHLVIIFNIIYNVTIFFGVFVFGILSWDENVNHKFQIMGTLVSMCKESDN